MMRMNIQPDDYFNNGTIEMARFGTNTVLKNNMSVARRNRLIKRLQKDYPKIKKKINRRILSIRKQISKCDPVQLLSFSSDMFLMSNLGRSSEIEASTEDIFISRMTEYIQSIIASTPIKHKPSKKDPSLRFFRIQRQLVDLHKQIQYFYFCWSTCFEKLFPDYTDDVKHIVFESQLLYLVRGQRYQFLEIEYYDRLLAVHNEIFTSTFGISSSEIVEGIKKLQHALSQGKIDAMSSLGELMDSYFETGETDVSKFNEMYPDAGREFAEKFLGTRLRNVITITGWPEKFVKSLSWEVNECKDFFDEKDFSGWPVVDLPIQKRPFIKIGDQYYCFDYYSFIDNFYRALQKTVSREVPSYRWSDFQKEASEQMVADVFSQILPGCSTFRDNYYPINKSLKNLAENDLLVQYGNVLLIVEVKAGSFVYTAPLTDFENHIVSYQNLIEKADKQCKNTYDYLLSSDEAIIYNQDKSIKTKINMREIKDIFTISLTIDNINDYAARAEKLKFLELKSKAICISIDDLMVYREFFDSPLVFLHFLQQRRQATQESKLALSDELDHLGMYIKHNMYCIQLQDYPDDAHIRFYGYREELDNYFCKLYHPQLCPPKPSLKIPNLFLKAINYLEKSDFKDKIQASTYLLDFSTDAREQLCQSVEYALQRQTQVKHMISFGTAGSGALDLRYTGFVEQPEVPLFTEEYKRQYTLSTLLWNDDPDRIMLDFVFDSNGHFISFKYTKYTIADIKQTEREKLWALGKERADLRLNIYLSQHQQINSSDICPCGSGKEYGTCCEKHLNRQS